jgi:hypothetical protein
MSYSELGERKLNEIKKVILKKKLMLNFLVDSYSVWDKAYRWGLITVATLTPLVNFVNVTVYEIANSSVWSIVISGLAAGMIKLKDYIIFDKIRDISKEQTIRYKQLYDRITNEMLKPAERRQLEDEFIYWLSRELASIEMNDPEMSNSDKNNFRAYCVAQNIPYDEDLTELRRLSDVQQSEDRPCPVEAQPNTPRPNVSNFDSQQDTKWVMERFTQSV